MRVQYQGAAPVGGGVTLDDAELFLSVLTVGEIRRGIESIHRRDRARARALNRWFM